MTKPVYAKSDKKNNVQEKSVFAEERESNIKYSVISDGDRELKEVKDEIHNKNSKKVEGYVEVEVNYNGEYNIKEKNTTSRSTQLSISHF